MERRGSGFKKILSEDGKEGAVMGYEITTYNSLVKDLKSLINAGRNSAYQSVNGVMLDMYWNIGRRIVTEDQAGEDRAKYGVELIKKLAEDLTSEYGTGFTARNLRNYRQFYLMFPDQEIWHACVPNLTCICS